MFGSYLIDRFASWSSTAAVAIDRHRTGESVIQALSTDDALGYCPARFVSVQKASGGNCVMVSQVLQRPTLVLNRSWQPVNVASVARALVMVWSDTAKVVDPADYQLYDWDDWSALEPDQDEPCIRSVSQRFRVPEVITLTQFNRLPTTTVAFSRRNLFKRDRFMCQYCGRKPKPDELTIDHVIPRSRGGGSSWENCVLACTRCNHSKADRTLKQAGMKLMTKPTHPKWNPIYSQHSSRYESWSKFISDAYWNAELKE